MSKSGTRCLLYLDGVAFDAQLNSSLSVDKDMQEVTVKAATRGKLFSGDGEYTGTVDLEVLYDGGATLGAFQVLQKCKDGVLGFLKIGESAAMGLQCSGFAKTLRFNFPKNEISTVPVTYQIHGEITTGTI